MSEINFDERLQELFDNFKQQLPTRLDTILTAWKGYLETGQQVDLEELRFHIHKLAGAASTYGFTEIGENARTVETRLDQFLKDGSREEVEAELTPSIRYIQDLIENC
ncbi:MAG: Hpt domain-containing protein [Gammaproteobacteria bacterium]|nr:Hpt domain-containing protein [Gammaproteobacteria bacterium]